MRLQHTEVSVKRFMHINKTVNASSIIHNRDPKDKLFNNCSGLTMTGWCTQKDKRRQVSVINAHCTPTWPTHFFLSTSQLGLWGQNNVEIATLFIIGKEKFRDKSVRKCVYWFIESIGHEKNFHVVGVTDRRLRLFVLLPLFFLRRSLIAARISLLSSKSFDSSSCGGKNTNGNNERSFLTKSQRGMALFMHAVLT